MKIDNINQTNFYGKTRYITENMKASVESLLIRMNHQYYKTQQGNHIVHTLTNKINMKNAAFTDKRELKEVLPHNKQMQGLSILDFGETHLEIDNETGEIIKTLKPFYKPWFIVVRKAEQILQEFRNNFFDSSVVKHQQSKIKDKE